MPSSASSQVTESVPARFTLDGDDKLERQLARLCHEVLAGVQEIVPPSKLEALVLGGGYGRGEGGVLKTELGDRPYNDLEFYVFVRGNRVWNERRFGNALCELGEALSPNAELHVEFKVDSLEHLRRRPITMFSYDLVSGHRVVWPDLEHGRPSLRGLQHSTSEEAPQRQHADPSRCRLAPGCSSIFSGFEHHFAAEAIPLSEATRLLMNRCSGLLFAQEKLRHQAFNSYNSDFVYRNVAKAQLAFGDVLLAVFGEYHWSCLERHERLRGLSPSEHVPWLGEACRRHAAGVEFKLHPRRPTASPGVLESHHSETCAFARKVWLWLESRRLGCPFESINDYVLSRVNKCSDMNPWRNLVANAKVFGRVAVSPASLHHHPRERVLNTLALLLWGAFPPRSDFNRQPHRLYLPLDAGFGKWVEDYQALWAHIS